MYTVNRAWCNKWTSGKLSLAPIHRLLGLNEIERMPILNDCINDERLQVSPRENKLMITDPPLNPKGKREKLLEVMFEKFEFESMLSRSQPVLSLCSQGYLSRHQQTLYSIHDVEPLIAGKRGDVTWRPLHHFCLHLHTVVLWRCACTLCTEILLSSMCHPQTTRRVWFLDFKGSMPPCRLDVRPRGGFRGSGDAHCTCLRWPLGPSPHSKAARSRRPCHAPPWRCSASTRLFYWPLACLRAAADERDLLLCSRRLSARTGCVCSML
jgi:hypothetical protein